MTNHDVAKVLEQIADVLQFKEENIFKINAYRKAARSVYHLETDINDLYHERRLEEISGVGRGVKSKIEELIVSGKCDYYEKLLAEFPSGVLAMLAIPGIGHATIKTIYEHLHIDNLNDLRQAAEAKQIRALPGLGGKTEDNIKKGIEMLKRNAGKVTLGMALPLAEHFRRYLLDQDAVENVGLTGSVRRHKPLVGDIDLLVAARQMGKVHRSIADYPEIKAITQEEKDHIKGLLNYDIEFEVIMVAPEDYYRRLVWTTGSKQHRNALVNAYGFNPDNHLPAGTEADIYRQMGLPWIPPEMRENTGEIEAAGRGELPELVQISDLNGDLHVHSNWSDGAGSIPDIMSYAREMGYSYIAVTDHSQSLVVTGGLKRERLQAQARIIDELNTRLSSFTILKGIEVDILRTGKLDFEDEVLEKLDVVVASIHSNFKLDREQQTQRIVQAIRNPHVNIIGHLTGRLLNRRNGYEVDVDRILNEAADNNVALEINSHPERLDVDEETARRAVARGVKLAINSDAHDLPELGYVSYGVNNARRGWVQKSDVINTFSIEELKKFLGSRK